MAEIRQEVSDRRPRSSRTTGSQRPDVEVGLEPGEERLFELKFALTPDTYDFRAEADADDVMDEVSEDDNRATASLTVVEGLPGPNLAFIEFTASPNPVGSGQPIDVFFAFQNVGTEDALGPTVGVMWSGPSGMTHSYADFAGDDMQPGRVIRAGFVDMLTAAGSYTFVGTVDNTMLITESGEDDNQATAQVTVNPCPRSPTLRRSNQISTFAAWQLPLTSGLVLAVRCHRPRLRAPGMPCPGAGCRRPAILTMCRPWTFAERHAAAEVRGATAGC